ncbi:hypothetical protein N9L68_02445 [bacterium]|nr:hypothetical protein [bacterium]
MTQGQMPHSRPRSRRQGMCGPLPCKVDGERRGRRQNLQGSVPHLGSRQGQSRAHNVGVFLRVPTVFPVSEAASSPPKSERDTPRAASAMEPLAGPH